MDGVVVYVTYVLYVIKLLVYKLNSYINKQSLYSTFARFTHLSTYPVYGDPALGIRLGYLTLVAPYLAWNICAPDYCNELECNYGAILSSTPKG